jgi:hypothetical protein
MSSAISSIPAILYILSKNQASESSQTLTIRIDISL